MENALPNDVIILILAFANKAYARLISRRFCRLTNAAILDMVSDRDTLALKGDLFSWLIRFGSAYDGFPTTNETSSFLFYVTQRAANYIAKDVIAASRFKLYNVPMYNREITGRVFDALLSKNMTIRLDRFRIENLNSMLYQMTGAAGKHNWVLREISDCITYGMVLYDIKQSGYMSGALIALARRGDAETKALGEAISSKIESVLNLGQ